MWIEIVNIDVRFSVVCQLCLPTPCNTIYSSFFGLAVLDVLADVAGAAAVSLATGRLQVRSLDLRYPCAATPHVPCHWRICAQHYFSCTFVVVVIVVVPSIDEQGSILHWILRGLSTAALAESHGE